MSFKYDYSPHATILKQSAHTVTCLNQSRNLSYTYILNYIYKNCCMYQILYCLNEILVDISQITTYLCTR